MRVSVSLFSSTTVRLSVCLSVSLSVQQFVNLSVCLHTCLLADLSIHLSVHHPSIRPSACRISVCLSIYKTVHLSVCLSSNPQPIHVCQSVSLSFFPSISHSPCLTLCSSVFLSVSQYNIRLINLQKILKTVVIIFIIMPISIGFIT
jgi:hypothetical protein